MIYHGSCISGLHTIKANSKSHSTGNFVAYFSEDRCYALVCCRSRDETRKETLTVSFHTILPSDGDKNTP